MTAPKTGTIQKSAIITGHIKPFEALHFPEV